MVSFNSEQEGSFCVMEIPSTLRAAREPEDVILREAEARGYAEETLFAVKLALEEAMTNAVKHGNDCDPGKRVTVRYRVTDETIEVVVRDEGGGFEPDGVPDPTTPDRLPLPNGRGIMLMRAYMDQVHYRRNGTEVYMMKRKGASE
jgi:serine/threonine-protein kinase RsbW